MIDSLYIGAVGMNAQQNNVEVIANNLANVNTNGFKRSRVSFESLLYRDVNPVGNVDLPPEVASRVGSGVAIADIAAIFTQGDMKKTDVPLDVGIQGQGFFEVILPDGSTAYTRDGHFRVNDEGYLSSSQGHVLRGNIQVPIDATDLIISPTGLVTARVQGEKTPVELGQIELVRFVNPGGLVPQGANLYTTSPTVGESVIAAPGEEGNGTLQQGFLESSNVKLVEEMIALIAAQRAYEVNTKVVQAADEMLGMSNNLRR